MTGEIIRLQFESDTKPVIDGNSVRIMEWWLDDKGNLKVKYIKLFKKEDYIEIIEQYLKELKGGGR